DLEGDWDDEDDVFGAAYDDVVFRDSADDGFAGEVADDGGRDGDSAIDLLTDELEPRLRFLDTLAQLWRMAAVPVAATLERGGVEPGYRRHIVQRVLTWVEHLGELQQGLRRLMRAVWDYDLGDP